MKLINAKKNARICPFGPKIDEFVKIEKKYVE